MDNHLKFLHGTGRGTMHSMVEGAQHSLITRPLHHAATRRGAPSRSGEELS